MAGAEALRRQPNSSMAGLNHRINTSLPAFCYSVGDPHIGGLGVG